MKKQNVKKLPEIAATDSNRRVIEAIQSGIEVDQKDEIGNTALIVAAGRGNDSLVKFLLKNGANVNAPTKTTVSSARGGTALIYAARYGHNKIVELLVQAGADVNARTAWAETPLYETTVRGDLKIFRYLVRHGAKPTLLETFVSIQNRRIDILRALLCAGADPNWKHPKTEQTLLGKAVHFTRDAAFVALLLKGGANPNAMTGRRYPLNLAAVIGDVKICKLLLRHGAKIDQQDFFKRTPVMDAAFKGHKEAVNLLLAKGADVRLRDNFGKSAWDLAKEGGNSKLLPSLLPSNASKSAENHKNSTRRSLRVRKRSSSQGRQSGKPSK